MTLDAHVDTPWQWYKRGYGGFHLNDGAVDAMRMKAGGLDKAIFAIYLSDGVQDRVGEQHAIKLIIAQLQWITQYAGVMLALEGARLLGSDYINCLQQLHAMRPLQYVTLVHNRNNQFADSATDVVNLYNLSHAGRDLVRELNHLGILIDVSHASDQTVINVLCYADGPILASHSGCRSLVDYQRNLPDNLIQDIAVGGGMICVPFARRFVGTKQGIADHINHVCSLTGDAMHVGIGSDLDGAVMVEGMEDVSAWSSIKDLLTKDFSDASIDAICGGNLMRLLDDVKSGGGDAS